MDRLSGERLSEIRARLTAAENPKQHEQGEPGEVAANIDLIAHAKQDLNWLLAEVEALQGELAALREALKASEARAEDWKASYMLTRNNLAMP